VTPCLISLAVKGCEEATYWLDLSTNLNIQVQVFQSYDWVVKVVSDAGTNCGSLTINLINSGSDLYGSKTVITSKTVSQSDAVTYHFSITEVDLPEIVSNI
jgi:hypothetical protein